MDDFGQIFRRLFNLPPIVRKDDPQAEHWEWNDHNSNKSGPDDFSFERRDNNEDFDRMFDHFHGNIFRHMMESFRQMEDVMKGFGAVDFPSDHELPSERGLPPTDEVPQGPHHGSSIWFGTPSPFFHFGESSRDHGRTPRDFMLKEDSRDEPALPSPSRPGPEAPRSAHPFFSKPDRWKRYRREEIKDTDLDGQLDDKQVVEMITKQPQEARPLPPVVPGPRMSSWGKSVSITRVQGPDGKIEERRIVRDSSGREESSVTKTVGDRSHTVTTVTGQDGATVTSETLKNLDEKDIDKFQSQWQTPSSPSHPAAALMPPDTQNEDRDLFSKLFGWRK